MAAQLDLFPDALEKKDPPPLPYNFDMNCKDCGVEMERLYPPYRIPQKPIATLQCPHCHGRLYVFETETVPIIASHKDLRRLGDFSIVVEQLIEDRSRRRQRALMRQRNHVRIVPAEPPSS